MSILIPLRWLLIAWLTNSIDFPLVLSEAITKPTQGRRLPVFFQLSRVADHPQHPASQYTEISVKQPDRDLVESHADIEQLDKAIENVRAKNNAELSAPAAEQKADKVQAELQRLDQVDQLNKLEAAVQRAQESGEPEEALTTAEDAADTIADLREQAKSAEDPLEEKAVALADELACVQSNMSKLKDVISRASAAQLSAAQLDRSASAQAETESAIQDLRQDLSSVGDIEEEPAVVETAGEEPIEMAEHEVETEEEEADLKQKVDSEECSRSSAIKEFEDHPEQPAAEAPAETPEAEALNVHDQEMLSGAMPDGERALKEAEAAKDALVEAQSARDNIMTDERRKDVLIAQAEDEAENAKKDQAVADQALQEANTITADVSSNLEDAEKDDADSSSTFLEVNHHHKHHNRSSGLQRGLHAKKHHHRGHGSAMAAKTRRLTKSASFLTVRAHSVTVGTPESLMESGNVTPDEAEAEKEAEDAHEKATEAVKEAEEADRRLEEAEGESLTIKRALPLPRTPEWVPGQSDETIAEHKAEDAEKAHEKAEEAVKEAQEADEEAREAAAKLATVGDAPGHNSSSMEVRKHTDAGAGASSLLAPFRWISGKFTDQRVSGTDDGRLLEDSASTTISSVNGRKTISHEASHHEKRTPSAVEKHHGHGESLQDETDKGQHNLNRRHHRATSAVQQVPSAHMVATQSQTNPQAQIMDEAIRSKLRSKHRGHSHATVKASAKRAMGEAEMDKRHRRHHGETMNEDRLSEDEAKIQSELQAVEVADRGGHKPVNFVQEGHKETDESALTREDPAEPTLEHAESLSQLAQEAAADTETASSIAIEDAEKAATLAQSVEENVESEEAATKDALEKSGRALMDAVSAAQTDSCTDPQKVQEAAALAESIRKAAAEGPEIADEAESKLSDELERANAAKEESEVAAKQAVEATKQAECEEAHQAVDENLIAEDTGQSVHRIPHPCPGEGACADDCEQSAIECPEDALPPPAEMAMADEDPCDEALRQIAKQIGG